MKITVIGAGYVGLVTGTCLAELGNNVTCVDIDINKITKMKNGVLPIYEPDLEIIFKRSIKEGRLTFSSKIEANNINADVIFLALPTPPSSDGSADLSYIIGAAKDIANKVQKYTVIVNKSTVPVGTADKVKQILAANSKADFDVISNPEFLREGFAVNDFMKPDRIIIGYESYKAKKIMEELYKPVVNESNKILFMDFKSAELTKYAANTFLAAKISFINEIANLSEKIGADIEKVKIGIGLDNRIGSKFLNAGIGYGGSCFPKDVLALIKSAEQSGQNLLIASSAMEINNKQKEIIVNKLNKYFGKDLKSKTIAIWGLAFKPDTDDIREAASITIINSLIKKGVNVRAYDPEAISNVKQIIKSNKVKYVNDMYKVLKNADALIIATEWAEFLSPDFEKMKSLLKSHIIFDGRNIYDVNKMEKLGFYYESIGRKISTGKLNV